MNASALKELLVKSLASEQGVVVWPQTDVEIPDVRCEFQLAYLGPEYLTLDPTETKSRLEKLLRQFGQTRREHRNGLAFAVPSGDGGDRGIAYNRFFLPTVGEGYQTSIRFDIAGFHPVTFGRADGLDTLRSSHRSVLAVLGPHLLTSLDPDSLIQIAALGKADPAGRRRRFFPLCELPRWFFSFLSLPKLRNIDVIREAVWRGLRDRKFGLLRSDDLIELDSKDPTIIAQIQWSAPPSESDITFDAGLYLASPKRGRREA